MTNRWVAAWRVFQDPTLLTRRGLVIERKPSVLYRFRVVLAPLKAWPLFVGLGMLIAVLLLERVQLFDANEKKLAAVNAESLVSYHNVILIVSELGFAFIIAWVVSLAIEAGARAEQKRTVDEALARVAHDVFEGALATKHQRSYVRSVVETCLEQTLTRESYRIKYRIVPFPKDDEERLGLDKSRFVLVHAKISYTVKNVGRHLESPPIMYGIPCRSGELRAFSKVTSLSIGSDKHTTDEQIAMFELSAEDIPAELGADANDRNYRFTVSLAPSETIDIVIEATLVKEMSDSDTFGFSRPTTGVTIQIDNAVPRLKFGVQPRTSGKLHEDQEPDAYGGSWQIAGSILPYQSVNLWWRSREDDGETNVPPLAEGEWQPPAASDVLPTDDTAAVKVPLGRRLMRLIWKEKTDEPV